MKTPFEVGDTSGITGMLIGLIIVVFTALGIGLLVEKEISLPSFSSSDPLVGKNNRLQGEINDLEIRVAARTRKATESERNRQQAKLVTELEKQIDSARKERDIIRRLITSENESMELLVKGREDHRLRYREQARMNAVGRTHPKITTRLGKEYLDVRVKSVTPLGVSISHSSGATRLGYRDMPLEWQKGLMYTAVEVAQATAEEQKRQIATRARSTRLEKDANKVRQTETKRNEIANLRRQIASLNMKYSTACLEANLARNKVSYNTSLRQSRRYSTSSYRNYNTSTGTYYRSSYRPRYRITLNPSRSVPGSLETWEQRAVRYERAKVRYGAQLASLRSRLASADPSYVPYPATSR